MLLTVVIIGICLARLACGITCKAHGEMLDRSTRVSGNVLIVDDESIFRKNLLQSLHRDGFVAIGATTRQEAWAILRCYPIGIVLLDLGLPDGDGMEMLAQVRREYPQMVVMVMTAQDTRELEGQAYRLGAQAFLRKPLSLQRLKARLRQYCHSAKPTTD